MTSPRTLLRAQHKRAKKKWGQHFLTDPSTAEMIVKRSAIGTDDAVLEIGAGLGALTLPLARAAGRVIAVEVDPHLIDPLRTRMAENRLTNVKVIQADILTVDISKMAVAAGRKMIVMGNLPYNISSQVLVQLIHSRRIVSRAVLMLQKELAVRIASPPGRKDYGRLSVMLQYCARISQLGAVDGRLFFPRPAVDSTVLEIRFRDRLESIPRHEAHLFDTIKAAFGQRRKNVKNALTGSHLDVDKKTAAAALAGAGIDPTRRAETLSVQEFVDLSNHLHSAAAACQTSTTGDEGQQ